MIHDQAIVRGKRQCVFTRYSGEFQLIVISDDTWQDQTSAAARDNYTLMFTLSPSAACLWEMLKDCPTQEALLSLVIARFGLSEEEAKDRLSSFLRTLEGFALIDYMSSPPPQEFSPYQLVSGCDSVKTEDIVFNKEDIAILPVSLAQEAFCQGLSDPSQGYAIPSDVGCQVCC